MFSAMHEVRNFFRFIFLSIPCLLYLTRVYGTEPVIGIDLGTTFSSVAVYKDGRVDVIANRIGKRLTPSYIGWDDFGELLVGEAARNQRVSHPEKTIYNIKRIIGRKLEDSVVEGYAEKFPFRLEPHQSGAGVDGIAVAIDPEGFFSFFGSTKYYSLEEISGIILSDLKSSAEDYLSRPVKKAVISVPADFNEFQRQATIVAAEHAGLEAVQLIKEPNAAALSFSYFQSSSSAERNLVVFDFGGGTLDVSLVSMVGSQITVKGTEGDQQLGGDDFDHVLMENLQCIAEHKGWLDLTNNKRAKQRFRIAAEDAKRALSYRSVYLVSVENGDYDLEVSVSRAQFELWAKSLFDRVLLPVERLLETAEMSPDDIDEVVMVGGSSRMPKVKGILEKYFGKKISFGRVNPDEAIVIGAAIQGAIINEELQGFELRDVLSLSLGVGMYPGLFSKVLKKNTPLPASGNYFGTAVMDYQTNVAIEIFQGERQFTEDNIYLGELGLDNLPRQLRGKPCYQVSFDVDSGSKLTVKLSESISGSKQQLVISRRAMSVSYDEIRRRKTEEAMYSSTDRERKQTVDSFVKLEKYLYILKRMTEDRQGIPEQSIEVCRMSVGEVREQVDEMYQWVVNHKDEEKSVYDTKKKEAFDLVRDFTDKGCTVDPEVLRFGHF